MLGHLRTKKIVFTSLQGLISIRHERKYAQNMVCDIGKQWQRGSKKDTSGMLVVVLNTCSKEELEESDEEVVPQPPHSEDSVERRKVIKNKILPVGRMAGSLRLFGS